jgi:hypothetical protein
VTVTLRADEPCTAVASARIRGVASFRRATRQLAAGRRAVVRLRLSARGQRAVRRALRRHRTLRLAIRVTTRDAAGNRSTLSLRARVRR